MFFVVTSRQQLLYLIMFDSLCQQLFEFFINFVFIRLIGEILLVVIRLLYNNINCFNCQHYL
jgi:TctA family transporter